MLVSHLPHSTSSHIVPTPGDEVVVETGGRPGHGATSGLCTCIGLGQGKLHADIWFISGIPLLPQMGASL